MQFRQFQLRQRFNSHTGFTLIEIAAVTAIVGIVMLYIVPFLKATLSGYSLYSSARLMASDIRCHQQSAIGAESENLTYEISFDISREEYSLKKGTANLQVVVLPPTVDLEEVTFRNRMLKFSLQGAPLEAGNIRLRDRVTQKVCYVIINPVAGRVRVDTGPPEN